jgi:uncharacterized protein (UPF0332 family)
MGFMPDEKSDKSELIHQRIQQAKESLNEVEILVQNKLLKIAVSRIYYGMFYMLLALALKHDFHTSKHQQLLGWFNKNFINTGIIDVSIGKIVNAAYENRSDSDYGLLVEFSEKDVVAMIDDMKLLISELEKHILD